jgi:hypothetical protein
MYWRAVRVAGISRVKVHKHYVHHGKSCSKRVFEIRDIEVWEPMIEQDGLNLVLPFYLVQGIGAADGFLSRPMHSLKDGVNLRTKVRVRTGDDHLGVGK